MNVSVAIEAITTLSYAMAHNRVPIISKLTLSNSGADLDAATVRIDVSDDQSRVTHECVLTVDLPTGSELVVADVPLKLDPGVMLQVHDRRPARLSVTVRDGDAVVGSAEVSQELLPGSHWLGAPPGLAFELLPAFVLPNDPAIGDLLAEAAVILQQKTGSPSMEGYQAGPERVDQVVSAIWDAAQARQIRYALPPASWDSIGQKVRTPTEVFVGRVGTCLDTTVGLAAAMEQAGIRPLLWVIDGHAFLAYWRGENALDAIAYPDGDEVLNYVDIGLMRFVETTAVTIGEESVPFEATHGLAAENLKTKEVHAVVDVWSARRSNVIPLPVRRQADDGTTQVIHYQAAAHSGRTVIVQEGEREATVAATHVPARVQNWKNALLDLSLRNRLINYTDRAGVRLRVPEGRLGEVEDLISANRALTLRPNDQIEAIDVNRGCRTAWDLPDDRVAEALSDKNSLFTDVASAGYLTRMRGLAYKARTLQEETGANNLYLALGSLVWDLDGRPLRSPLILVPVRLVTGARGQLYKLQLDESGGSTPNYCLLEKLRQVHGLTIPKLAEPEQDLSGVDLDDALQATRIALAEKGLPYRVEPSADLSILQFAKFRLWKDLDEHWQGLMQNSLVRHLVETPTDPFEDPISAPADAPDLDALDAVCPVPADASQLSAVAEAVAGRTFVLEGPPGTGKSQTITNMLTRAVAEGKRVLFVAEKRAALDVVSSRLDSVGMGHFSLDLHDKASKPAVVREQIRKALDHAVEVDEQGLTALEEDLRSSRRTLARYAERLHEENPAGLSYYSARTQLLALGEEGPRLPVSAGLLSRPDTLEAVRRQLVSLPDVADPARPEPDHPWGFARMTEVDGPRLEAILAASREVNRTLALLPTSGPIMDLLPAAQTPEDLGVITSIAQAPVPLHELDQCRTPGWHEGAATLRKQLDDFVAAQHPGLDRASAQALDLPLIDLHAQAQAAEASGFFGRGKRRKAVLAQVAGVLRPGVEVKAKDVEPLLAVLRQVQQAMLRILATAQALPGVRLAETWNAFDEGHQRALHAQLDWLTWAGYAVDPSDGAGPLAAAMRAWLQTGEGASTADIHNLDQARTALAELRRLTDASTDSLRSWSGPLGIVWRWRATSGRRTDEELPLRRWAAFQAALAPLRAAGLDAAADALTMGESHADDAARAFDRGLAQASQLERRQATGLDAFDPLAHDRAVSRFTSSVQQVRQQMTAAVPAQVIAARPFQVSTARGQVGELQRELAKQRRGLGVRALMERYGTLITQVMPCVLVSPDSVARFFPVGSQKFDLVVFDEASQIRVADAIGAMGRAASVVVVGDSKQMPPTSFAEPSVPGDDDTEVIAENVVEDEESILTEAVLARVPQRWLTWHYRSKDESLIAFSNARYYDSKLSSFPAPTQPQQRLENGHGISLVRVDGRFRRNGTGKLLRTNTEEAEAIVAEIRRRFDASPDVYPSLGVVTFNQQQRTYIEGLLRDTQDERLLEALEGTNGEGLFVKNLENVQGDERDVILFSTAFSTNDKGDLPLNFGPLTRAGGERRLNVAITRARRQVVIYSSFDPSQLRVERTQSVGIHHLRGYLELAASGSELLESTGQRSTVPDRHRDEIARRLTERGVRVSTDVGLSDFRVDLALAPTDRPDEPRVAVLLDGPGWASRRTVGDRDGLPVEVLGRLMGWPAVERVWMPAWLADPEATLDRLVRAVSAPPKAQASPPRPASPPVAAPQRDLATVAAPVRPAAVAPVLLPGQEPFVGFEAARAGTRDVLDALPSAWSARKVREVIDRIVAAEGPVHLDRLARLTAASFDLTRLNQTRIDSITRQVPAAMRLSKRDPFAWPADKQPDSWTGFRSSPTGERPLEHIALREIGNAMVALCNASAGMTADELAAETLVVFGWKRRTAGMLTRLEEALALVISHGRLRLGDRGHYEVG